MNANTLRVEWGERLKEIEEAKTIYQKARAEGRRITDLDGAEVSHFRSSLRGFLIHEIALKPSEFAMRIFDETGDRRLIWNSLDPDQIREAAKIFNDYLSRGWKAYAVDEKGQKGARIFGFSGEKQELYFDERTTNDKLRSFAGQFAGLESQSLGKGSPPSKRQRLSEFAQSFKTVKLLPRTYPG
jgi:hypothetical protein